MKPIKLAPNAIITSPGNGTMTLLSYDTVVATYNPESGLTVTPPINGQPGVVLAGKGSVLSRQRNRRAGAEPVATEGTPSWSSTTKKHIRLFADYLGVPRPL